MYNMLRMFDIHKHIHICLTLRMFSKTNIYIYIYVLGKWRKGSLLSVQEVYNSARVFSSEKGIWKLHFLRHSF